MSALVLTLLRLGFLALLWIFVFSVIFTVRRDVNGTQVRDRRTRSSSRNTKNAPASQPAPAEPHSAAHSAVHSAPHSAPHRPMPTVLTVTDGPLAGTSLPLGTAQIIVGRSPDCALVLGDTYSSSRHARFYMMNNQWWVEDLDSTNGTYVNNQRISSPTLVVPGTPIVIGRTTVEMR